ncbi:unnamed protein product [Allacma fusca]|uniref:Uncharacterized protein n=1 Tax=Allacma fusca TaxID=39272 RepID=A0A8J2K389_9HEXA|nr:unnamed protein product [Allacma fusca]
MNNIKYFSILAICIVGIEAKSYYETLSPNGTPAIQPFREGQPMSQGMKPFDGQTQYPLDKDYYVSFLEMEVDSNLVIASTAFLLTLLLLTVNLFYPLSQIHLPLIDGKPTRDSRNIAIPEDLDEISSKIKDSSKNGLEVVPEKSL